MLDATQGATTQWFTSGSINDSIIHIMPLNALCKLMSGLVQPIGFSLVVWMGGKVGKRVRQISGIYPHNWLNYMQFGPIKKTPKIFSMGMQKS